MLIKFCEFELKLCCCFVGPVDGGGSRPAASSDCRLSAWQLMIWRNKKLIRRTRRAEIICRSKYILEEEPITICSPEHFPKVLPTHKGNKTSFIRVGMFTTKLQCKSVSRCILDVCMELNLLDNHEKAKLPDISFICNDPVVISPRLGQVCLSGP